LLYPLEIRCESTETTPSEAPLDPKPSEPLPEADVTEEVCPKRAASNEGDSLLQNWGKTIE